MRIKLRFSRVAPTSVTQYLELSRSNEQVFTHVGPIMLEVQTDGAIHAIAQDFERVRTYVVSPEDAVAFAKAILSAAKENHYCETPA